MKNLSKKPEEADEMRAEYDFSGSISNKYASILKRQERLIRLEPDVYQVFNSDEKVNKALRAFINAMPEKKTKKLQKV